MTAIRQLKKRPASRPQIRTVTVSIADGDFAGWEATARADFPARILLDFESGKMTRVIAALDAIIIDHNFPNAEDELAASMAEVDPYGGLEAIADRLGEAITKLPNR